MIYVIQESGSGNVKLGFTDDIHKRLIDLQVCNPNELRVIAVWPGGKLEDEKLFHQYFSEKCVRGEWFNSEIIKTLRDNFSWKKTGVTRIYRQGELDSFAEECTEGFFLFGRESELWWKQTKSRLRKQRRAELEAMLKRLKADADANAARTEEKKLRDLIFIAKNRTKTVLQLWECLLPKNKRRSASRNCHS